MNLQSVRSRLQKLETRRSGGLSNLSDHELRDLLQAEFADVCGRFHIQPATLGDVPEQVMDDPLAAEFFELYFAEIEQ